MLNENQKSAIIATKKYLDLDELTPVVLNDMVNAVYVLYTEQVKRAEGAAN